MGFISLGHKNSTLSEDVVVFGKRTISLDKKFCEYCVDISIDVDSKRLMLVFGEEGRPINTQNVHGNRCYLDIPAGLPANIAGTYELKQKNDFTYVCELRKKINNGRR
jgi:hypothetical protein